MCLIYIGRELILKWMAFTFFRYIVTAAFFLNEKSDFHAKRSQVHGTISSIKYTPNEALRAIHNRIFQ